MNGFELIKLNKKHYENQLIKNDNMTGLSQLVGKYLMLPWIKGNKWMGGISDSVANKAFEKIMAQGYDYDEIDAEFHKQMDEIELNESIIQYYGIDKNGKARFVAMSEQEVKDWAENNPEDGIVKIEDSNGRKFSLSEALSLFDRKEFRDNSNNYELEMLYESNKTALSSQQKNELSRFVRQAKTAEEVNTYMTTMLNRDKNESLINESNFEDFEWKIIAYSKEKRLPKSLSNYISTGYGYSFDVEEFKNIIYDCFDKFDGRIICNELNSDKDILGKFKPYSSTDNNIKIIHTDYNGNEDVISITRKEKAR